MNLLANVKLKSFCTLAGNVFGNLVDNLVANICFNLIPSSLTTVLQLATNLCGVDQTEMKN